MIMASSHDLSIDHSVLFTRQWGSNPYLQILSFQGLPSKLLQAQKEAADDNEEKLEEDEEILEEESVEPFDPRDPCHAESKDKVMWLWEKNVEDEIRSRKSPLIICSEQLMKSFVEYAAGKQMPHENFTGLVQIDFNDYMECTEIEFLPFKHVQK